MLIAWGILKFLIALSILIGIHELGHLLVARYFGFAVSAFSIGMGEPIFRWRRGEIEYRIGRLPFGGYVTIHGVSDTIESRWSEGAELIRHGRKDEEVKQLLAPKRLFVSKPGYQQFLVSGAGPFANILVSMVLMWIILVGWGVTQYEIPLKVSAYSNLRESKSMLQAGDKILQVNGIPIDEASKLQPALFSVDSDQTTVVLLRDEKLYTNSITAVSTKVWGLEKKKWLPGVSYDIKETFKSVSLIEAAKKSADLGLRVSHIALLAGPVIIDSLGDQQKMSGPIGMFETGTKVAQQPTLRFLEYLLGISAGLAVFNCLPILPLDGGRMLLALYKVVRRREASETFKACYAIAGILSVLGIVVVASYFDISKHF